VWGGHLEPGTLVLRGADLLVGFLPIARPVSSGLAEIASASASPAAPDQPAPHQAGTAPAGTSDPETLRSEAPRVEIAVLPRCPWSARAMRMLRTLSIPHRVIQVDNDALRAEIAQRSGSSSLPQVFVDGDAIGGYDALAESHGRRELEPLRLS
jgi:glutaredoxin